MTWQHRSCAPLLIKTRHVPQCKLVAIKVAEVAAKVAVLSIASLEPLKQFLSVDAIVVYGRIGATLDDGEG